MKKTLLALSLIGLTFAACNSSSDNNSSNADSTGTTAATEAPAATEVPQTVTMKGDTAEVYLAADDGMHYSATEIKVTEGQTVILKLEDVGSMAKASMAHNFVLLKSGMDINDFAGKCATAATEEYLPKAELKDVIAHTKLLGPGESDVITFKAPAAGDYPFLCTFPGHHVNMNGHLIVEKKK